MLNEVFAMLKVKLKIEFDEKILYWHKAGQSQYILKRCSNKECCKQCRYVMFKGTMTK